MGSSTCCKQKREFSSTPVLDMKDCSLSAARRQAPAATPATPAASTNGENSHRRRVITKPPVPKQTPIEKKPPVPRAPRHPRPLNAPTPDLKNVRSKIGSTDNMKYQPGGGKVGADSTVEVSKGTVVLLFKSLFLRGGSHTLKRIPVLVAVEDDRVREASKRPAQRSSCQTWGSSRGLCELAGGHQCMCGQRWGLLRDWEKLLPDL